MCAPPAGGPAKPHKVIKKTPICSKTEPDPSPPTSSSSSSSDNKVIMLQNTSFRVCLRVDAHPNLSVCVAPPPQKEPGDSSARQHTGDKLAPPSGPASSSLKPAVWRHTPTNTHKHTHTLTLIPVCPAGGGLDEDVTENSPSQLIGRRGSTYCALLATLQGG